MSVKRCSEPCRARWELIATGVAWIDAYATDQTEHPARQLTLLGEVG